VSIRSIVDPLAGERIVALSPETATEAASDWLRRPNLFPGRALTADTLNQRQQWQAGHIAERGQDWTAGVVDGFQVEAAPVASASGFAAVRLRVAQGRGLAVSGEDVVLNQALSCLLADMPVVAPPGFFVDGSGVGPAGSGEPAGSLRPRSIGATLGTLPAAALADLPTVGVLVLQPVLVDNSNFDAMDPCDRCAWPDPTQTDTTAQDPVSFEDWRIADAVRLLWYVWPQEWSALPSLPVAQWRNALAWSIFTAEAKLQDGAALPWEPWGVPIAMVGLDAGHQPLWIDRASVVRQGGRARDARLQLAGSGLAANDRLPQLWQAQIEQFAEQIAAAGDPTPDPATLAGAFGSHLPPVGLLPRNAFDTTAHHSGFFPAGYDIDAVPVPVDQLDVAIRQAAALAPLDVNAQESVRILVPVTLASWEPRLLMTEVIDPEFQATLDSFLLTRARELGARQGLRNERAVLTRAITGKPQTVPGYDDDTGETETLSPWGPPPEGGGHRNPVRAGFHSFSFDSATTPFAIGSADTLYTWIYLDPDHPPASLLLSWHLSDGSSAQVYWGAALADALSAKALGDLPATGRWIKLAVTVADSGIALNNNAAQIDGMAFGMVDGRAAFGATGATTVRIRPILFNTIGHLGGLSAASAASVGLTLDSAAVGLTNINLPHILPPLVIDRPWFANVLPAGARVAAQSEADDPWEALSDNDLWTPFDPAGGVVPSLPDTVPAGDGGHTEPARAGLYQHFFQGTAQTLKVSAGDRLYAWVYLDANEPPRELMLQWNINGSWEHRAYWGRDLIGWGSAGSVSRQRIDAMPDPGKWVRLEVPIATVGFAANDQINGMAFTLYDGCAAFSGVGVIGADNVEHTWFSRFPPSGAVLFGNWNYLDPAALYAPTPGARIGQVEILRDLMSDPLFSVLSAEERAQLPLRGLAAFVDYLRARIDRADDITDYGFVKMQTDIYRLRQLVLGSEANRLAISPALAGIAKADTAVATQAQLADYVAKLKTSVN